MPLAVFTAVALPLAALGGLSGAAIALAILGVAAMIVCVLVAGASAQRPARTALALIVACLGPGIAAASVIVARGQGNDQAVALIAGVLAYDVGAFLMGDRRSVSGGPVAIAGGLVSVAVVALFVAAVMNPPFSGTRPWVLFGAVALFAPLGVLFLDLLFQERRLPAKTVTRDTLSRLARYDWPGNVRELRNTIERATIMAGSGLLASEHLPPHFGEPGFAPVISKSGRQSVQRDVVAADSAPPNDVQRYLEDKNTVRVEVGTTVDEAEKQLILKTLDATHNNKTKAAEILGISAKTLQNKLKEYSNAAASSVE